MKEKLPFSLSVLTYNVAGLPSWVGPPFKIKRAELIRKSLNEMFHWQRADVICLQEVWFPQFRWMVENTAFPYHIGNRELPLGTGLYTLSRFPIGRWHQQTFNHSPRFPEGQFDGEAHVRKGFYLAEINTPQGQIWVGNAHMTSNYAPWGKDYREYRKKQIHQMFDFAQHQRGKSPLILAGDFNLGPGEYTEDPIWDDLPRIYPEIKVVDIPHDVTTYSRKNTFNSHWTYPCRLDHLFYSKPLEVFQYRVVFQDLFPLSSSVVSHLSDHYGILTDFHLPTEES